MGSCMSKTTSGGRHSQPKQPVPLPTRHIQRSAVLSRNSRPQNHIAVRSLLSTFPRVPNEILLEIAKSLDTARDLYALRRVNKRLAVLVEHVLSDFLVRAYHNSATRYRMFSTATRHHESLVPHLVRLGVDLNTTDCDCAANAYCRCRPALHHAVAHRNEAMVHSLLHHGVRINAPYNRKGDNAVHLAIQTTIQNSGKFRIPRSSDLAILRMLLSDGVLETMNDPASLNTVSLSWLNMAVRCCSHENMSIVEPFLVTGLSIDIPDQEQMLTPLHAAVWNNNVNLATALLTFGADHRTVDLRGASPFGTACNRPNCALIDVLLRHDATLIDEVVSDRGETADLCLQRMVEHLMAMEDLETNYRDREVPARLKLLEKLRKLVKARKNTSTSDTHLQIYYNCL